MNIPNEPDLLGYVLGALDAPDRNRTQQAIDSAPELEDDLLNIKNALVLLDDLDTDGTRPGLARRTCELVANISHEHPVVRLYNPLDIDPEILVSGCLAGDSSNDDNDQNNTNSAGLISSPASAIQTRHGFYDDAKPGLTNQVLASGIAAEVLATVKSSVAMRADLANDSLSPVPSVPSASTNQNGSRASERSVSASSTSAGVGWYRSPFSFTDLAVGIGFIGVLLGLLFPAVSFTRHQSRILSCQNNLKQIGIALNHYSDQHGGRFVAIPRSGPLSTVGAFAPILKEQGLIHDDAVFNCAGALAIGNQQPIQIPSIELVREAVQDQLTHLQKRLSGHYGYTMGYCENGNYCSPRNMGRSNVVLVTDTPSLNPNQRVSPNHGSGGQNCLFEDGRVQFIVGDTYGDDALFVNDYNLVAPGCRPCDNVIAPSHLSPVFALGHR